MLSKLKLFMLISKILLRNLAPNSAEVLISVYKSARFSTPISNTWMLAFAKLVREKNLITP